MKTFNILIMNPKTKLCKIISPIGYSKKDMAKTFKFYHSAGYKIKIIPVSIEKGIFAHWYGWRDYYNFRSVCLYDIC